VPDSDHDSARVVETTTEARAGSTPHMTRYVLGFGLLLIIVLFAIVVLVGRS
jgi:hypothetical protein